MDAQNYLQHSKEKLEAYEGLCRRCGRCCGLQSDPCVNLIRQPDNSYFCKVYPSRLGKQRTVSGSEFTCVEVRDHVALGYTIEGCPYFS